MEIASGPRSDASSGRGEAGTVTGVEAGREVGTALVDVGSDSSLSPRDASVEEGAPSSVDARNPFPAPCSAPGCCFVTTSKARVGPCSTPPKWGMQLNGAGTVVVDSSIPAHSGSHSVHVNASGYQTFFVTRGPPAFPAPGGKCTCVPSSGSQPKCRPGTTPISPSGWGILAPTTRRALGFRLPS